MKNKEASHATCQRRKRGQPITKSSRHTQRMMKKPARDTGSWDEDNISFDLSQGTSWCYQDQETPGFPLDVTSQLRHGTTPKRNSRRNILHRAQRIMLDEMLEEEINVHAAGDGKKKTSRYMQLVENEYEAIIPMNISDPE